MNRILYEASEIQGRRLVLTDGRATHVREVLRAAPGTVLKTGEVEGPRSEGTVRECSAERVVLDVRLGETPPRVTRDLILALPRPKVLNRLLSQIAALGVDRLVLCNASRVERYYFDSHVLEPARLRARLVEGLTQAGDTRLPRVRIVKRLRHFLEDDAAAMIDGADAWILHPDAPRSLAEVSPTAGRQVLAIGPEGGWRPTELAGFEAAGFRRVALLDRILRSDTAVVAALSHIAMRGGRGIDFGKEERR